MILREYEHKKILFQDYLFPPNENSLLKGSDFGDNIYNKNNSINKSKKILNKFFFRK